MKSGYIAALGSVMVMAGRILAQESPPQGNQPPQYTLSRWDEDYRYLRDPAARDIGEKGDLFDPIKYIRFNDKGDIYLSLGGQFRYRYEFYNDENFGLAPDDTDGFHLFRLLAHADLHIGNNFRLFVQGKSALEEDRDGGPRAVDADEVDIQQAFGELSFRFNKDTDSVMLRVGRQDMMYGAQRLIGVSDWTNVRRTFEGVRGSIGFSNNTLDLFWMRPVKVKKEGLNEGDDDTNFVGIYDVISLPGFMREAHTKIDLYGLWLGHDNTVSSPAPANDSDTYTVGVHFYSNPRPWDVDLEGDYQWGDQAGDDIRAWSFASELGYTLHSVTWTPRLLVGFDIASGDDDEDDGEVQTFNQLFPSEHLFLGAIDVIGRQNIMDAHGGLEFKLAPVVGLRVDQHFFWRESTHDALYSGQGAVLIPAGSSDTNYVGSEFDVVFDWQLDRHWSTYVGYSHFFAGDFVEESGGAASGADNDIDFVYGAVVFTF